MKVTPTLFISVTVCLEAIQLFEMLTIESLLNWREKKARA